MSETVFRPQGERDGCSLIYLEFRLPWVVDGAFERTLGRLEVMAWMKLEVDVAVPPPVVDAGGLRRLGRRKTCLIKHGNRRSGGRQLLGQVFYRTPFFFFHVI